MLKKKFSDYKKTTTQNYSELILYSFCFQKFSGFYQNEVDNNLTNADSILRLAGFTEIAHGILVLTKHHKAEDLKEIAFECFVASAECKITADFSEKARLSKQSKLKTVIGAYGTDVDMYNTVDAANVPDRICISSGMETKVPTINDGSGTEQHRIKLQEHMRKAQKLASPDMSVDFPFLADESKQAGNFEEGTLDDHVKASLQIVENSDGTPTALVEPVPRSISASQEWDFVHQGLKQKFGKQYFQGQRKDILDTENGTENKKNTLKHKQFVQSVKVGEPSWQEYLARSPNMGVTVNSKGSFNDSAYQSTNQATFPPSLPSDKQFLARSASATYGRKFDSDVMIKKGSSNNQDGLYSRTVPILKRTSAPVHKHEVDSLTNHIQSIPVSQRNEQGVETIRNYQNDLSKGSITGAAPRTNQIAGAQLTPSAGRTSGLGESINSHDFAEKGKSELDSIKGSSDNGYSGQVKHFTPKWPCMECTFLNDCSTNICVMCSKTRDGVVDTDAPSVGDAYKICDQCTFQNDNTGTHCQVCGNPLGGSQTVV